MKFHKKYHIISYVLYFRVYFAFLAGNVPQIAKCMVFLCGILLLLRDSLYSTENSLEIVEKMKSYLKISNFFEGRFTGQRNFDVERNFSPGILFLPVVSYFYSQNRKRNFDFALGQTLYE